MQDVPLFTAHDAPAGINALADLLLAGIDERPMWARFLAACANRCGACYAALVFVTQQDSAVHPAILTPVGIDPSELIRLHEKKVLDELAVDDPVICEAGEGDERESWLILPLALDPERRAYLALRGRDGSQAFAADAKALLRCLLPVLQRVVRLYIIFGDSERRRIVAEHVLETSGVGIVLVDGDGNVVTINSVARAIMRESGVLSMAGGRIKARRTAENAQLDRQIRQKVAEQSAHAGPDLYTPIAFARDDSPYPITVIVRPGPAFAPVSAPMRRTAVLILRDPARRGAIFAPDLERLFNLSPAEARLAAMLADGLSLDDVATELGIRRNTVRSQLQAVFLKTGTNRQGDLVRLVWSSAATLARQEDGTRVERPKRATP